MKQRKTMFRFEQMGTVHKLYVYDDVTAHGSLNWETWEYDESETSAGYFRKQLEEIPESDTIELHINSNGGDVKEGVAIYNMLKHHKAQKTCYVDGFAYSIASVICMACDRIIMGLGTSMLIHNMSAYLCGNAVQLRKMADDLDVLMESNRKIYMERAKNLTEVQLTDMMDKETFLTPEKCLEYGFCDEIDPMKIDSAQTEEQATVIIRELRQELNNRKALKEELMLLVSMADGHGVQPDKKESKQDKELEMEWNTGNQKALKMIGAFLNAIT